MTAVRLDVEGDGVGVISLCGEDRLNVFDLAMRDALIDVLDVVERHPDIRALLLRADGEHFCAGADLRQFGRARHIFEARWIRWRRDPWSVLWEMPVPIVAALRGVAMGSGLEMAMLCDVRLCHPATRLGLPEARLAMLPGAGGTQSLSRVIGPSGALPLVLLGGEISVVDALRLGLVDAISDDVDGDARALASTLASLPADAVRATKRALRAAADTTLEAGLLTEHRLADAVGRGR